jgi:hypothetical protein
MDRLVAASILVLIAMPVLAAELPSRKPGQWEITMTLENRNVPGQTVRQCIDAATDQSMQSSAGAFAQAACPRRDVQRSGNLITIDSTCTVGGKPSTSHAVITGSFDSAYTMKVTSQSEGGASRAMTISAKWLGPCATDQKPGDMITADGTKLNILEMQKRPPSSIPAR